LNTTRRNFLQQSLLAIPALSWATGPAGAEPAGSTHWAFFSDIHIKSDPNEGYRGFHIRNNLQKVIREVISAGVEGAVITGDLARLEGYREDYQALASLLSPLAARMPVGYVLGNHDHRKNFLEFFPTRPGQPLPIKDKLVTEISTPVADFLLLDSQFIDSQVPGLLGKAEREWLQQNLPGKPGKPLFLFVHHDLDDSDTSLLDADRLLRIVEPIARIKAIVYGHTHRYGFKEVKGIHLINLPATAYNFSVEQPIGWVEASLRGDGADFKLHAIGGGTAQHGKVTTLRWR
jgi:3',5'-cyclic AMP phosphodiesterase CpdA